MPPDRPSWLRLRLWLLVAGGPAASIAVLWAIRAGGVPFHGTGGALWWVQALAMGILVNLIGRLFPYSMRNGDELVPSDGLQLWRVLTASAGELRASFVPSFAVEASIELGFGHPKLALVAAERGQVAGDARTAPLFWLLQASAHSNLGDPAKGRALAANALAADLAPSLRSLALNDWSWHAFRARDDGDLRLADQRSAEALGVHAKSPAVSGTRAAILLWRGRVGQAIPLLEKALATSRLPRASASDACLLAMAHASRGESVRAQSLLERARRLVPEHPLLAEAGRYVGAAVAGLRVLYASRGRRALLVEPDGVELLEGVVGRFDDRETLRAAAARRQRLTLS
jgi:tetratricopeptide (TPR) repeat protein